MNVQVQAKVVDAGHIVKVNSDGSLSVYNRYYENGKEKIARFPNEYMTAKHNYQLEKIHFVVFQILMRLSFLLARARCPQEQ